MLFTINHNINRKLIKQGKGPTNNPLMMYAVEDSLAFVNQYTDTHPDDVYRQQKLQNTHTEITGYEIQMYVDKRSVIRFYFIEKKNRNNVITILLLPGSRARIYATHYYNGLGYFYKCNSKEVHTNVDLHYEVLCGINRTKRVVEYDEVLAIAA